MTRRSPIGWAVLPAAYRRRKKCLKKSVDAMSEDAVIRASSSAEFVVFLVLISVLSVVVLILLVLSLTNLCKRPIYLGEERNLWNFSNSSKL